MATNLQMYFGVDVKINREIPKSKYMALLHQVRASLKAKKLSEEKVGIYIHHISISAAERHFRIGPVSKRMDKLKANLQIAEKAKQNNLMKFMNHELQISYQNSVAIECHDFQMGYALTGQYCETHDGFDDYVALLVDPSCAQRYKRLQMTLVAKATPAFADLWINKPDGIAITKISFDLGQDIQLTF
jgi:hypothetical protein